MISELELQAFLFEKDTKRRDLISFVPTIDAAYRVSVYRNHSFELIENTIKPFLEYAGFGIEFSYSNYDDSLSFLELDLSADLVILWLDLSAYSKGCLNSFIEERIKHLRAIFDGNILFVPSSYSADFDVMSLKLERAGVTFYALSKFETRLGEAFLDLRMEPFSGTKLSSDAIMEISRDLGLNMLPALLRPNLKGVVVDLDNTLYKGVLGEDGVHGLVLTDGHRQLQKTLRDLSQQGFFLCIASKNDTRDVEHLFAERGDFPLQISDFSEIYANWNAKADSISSIAKSLNVAIESLVLIDDNVGELASVLEAHPDINVICAKDKALITHTVVCNYPGLLKLGSKKEDRLRSKDTAANKKRRKAQRVLSREEYIRDLEMELLYEVDNVSHVARVAELANKTNQFIFSYQRYSAQQIETLMSGRDSTIVTVSLRDKLSDSGIVGVLVLKKNEESSKLETSGVVVECFVSCRALGRSIDEVIVLGGVSVALKSLGTDRLLVNFIKGQRNLPAEKFNKQYFGAFQASPGYFEYVIPENLIAVTIK